MSAREVVVTDETFSVDHHFRDRSPVVRSMYDRLVSVASTFGPVTQEPKKTSIHLTRKTAFAGVATRKTSLILTLKSDRDISSPRISKHERASAHRWHLELKITDTGDIDDEVVSWLKSAYSISG